MIKKAKEYNVLEVEDVEALVSEMVGRHVSINEMDVRVFDAVPRWSAADNAGLYCEVYVDGEEVCDDDYNCPLDEVIPDEAFLDEEFLFDFDPHMFASYSRETDTSD